MNQSRTWIRRALAPTLALTLCAGAWAQSSFLGPKGDTFRINAGSAYNQYWVRVDVSPDGARFGTSFNSGQDPFARFFSADGTALGGNVICNPATTTYIQDEAEIGLSATGRALVAWSERHGYDGEQMGIFGRIFDASGVPIGGEFQINEAWQASQWRPIIARRPQGGWVVAWSGEWDGDAFVRVLGDDGSFLSGDVKVNTWDFGGQTDTALAIAPDGTMLVVFVDYSGFGGIGTGTNLWGRLFTSDGVPLQSSPWPINTPAFTGGDQREPRVAADGSGHFVVVWEDALNEGSGWGIFARRFDSHGAPLGSEQLVNEQLAGHQRNARAVADAQGNFIVTWDSLLGGQKDVLARRFDAAGQPLTGDITVHDDVAGDQQRPSLALFPSGEEVIFVWEGPGDQIDVYGRIFSTYQSPTSYCLAEPNSAGCTPSIASSGEPSLTGPDDFHVLASEVLNKQPGVLFWGLGAAAVPFGNGTLCIQPPVVRTALQNSGGNPLPLDCSGTYDLHLTQAYFAGQGLTAGTILYAQYWTRDPGPGDGIGLTDGLAFELRP